jgi:hypothetical protein
LNHRHILILFLGLAAPALAQSEPATEPAANIAETQAAPTLFSRIRGLFDIDLPELDPPGTVRFKFSPRFGDFVHRDYVRVPTGLKWTPNDVLELNAEVEAYFHHYLGGGEVNNGIGEFRGGFKYVKRQWPTPDFESSFGLNVEIPTGSPPLDLTDGRNHYMPFAVVQYRWANLPKLTTFGGVTLDIVTDSSVRGSIGRNTPVDDSFSITGGAVYDLGQLKWTLQSTYTTTALVTGTTENFLTVQPSVLWFVPRKFTRFTNTQWIVGFGARSTWGPDGHEFNTSSRVRAEVTFGQVVDRLRGAVNFRR